MKTPLLAIAGTALIALSAHSATSPLDAATGLKDLAPSQLLDNSNGQNDQWKGIGRLQISQAFPDSHCTASLIDTRDDQQGGKGPAYVLSSAHCVSLDSVNAIVKGATDGHIDFNYFHDTEGKRQRYALKEVSWSRQRGMDMAIIELDVSLQTLIDAGITPLALTYAAPAAGDAVRVVGAPTKYPEKGLRLSACRYVSTETLIEQPSVYRDFYKDQCDGLKPGSSGSPLLNAATNEVLGVVSTSTTDALEENRCFENAPCELKDGQPSWSANSNYSSPVAFLPRCFAGGQFTPTAAGCDLMPSLTLSLKGTPVNNYYRRVKKDAEGHEVLPTWRFSFGLDTPFYRYKTVRDPQLCEDPNDYSDVRDAGEAHIKDPLGPQAGAHLLCIVGVASSDLSPTPAMMKGPVVLAMEVASPGPTRAPQFDIEKQDEGGYSIAWRFSRPTLSGYEYKAGKIDTTDCDDAMGYQRTLQPLQIAASELPVKLCTKAIDMSGQRSSPRTDELMPGGKA